MKEIGVDTNEAIEKEIAELRESPYVKLSQKEERIRYRRRRYLYQLRWHEKNGRKLAEAGITMERLDDMDAECDMAAEILKSQE